MITMSHAHHDHCETGRIVGAPVVARDTEAVCVGGVASHAVGSYHDGARGAKRGPNAIRIFEIDGLKVVHMGDQGCMPDEAALAAIAGADVMMIPTGGTYTVDAQGAKAIVEAAKPRCVIPMHVRTRRCTYPIAPVTDFLRAMGAQDAQPVRELISTRDGGPQGVVVMLPMADAL